MVGRVVPTLAIAAAAAASLPGAARADGLSDLMDYMLELLVEDNADFQLDASVVAESDTDLNFTAALTLTTNADVDVNMTIAFTSEKCDIRNMEATVAVDLISPDVLSQGLCWLLGSSCPEQTVTTNVFEQTFLLQPDQDLNVSSWNTSQPLGFSVDFAELLGQETDVAIHFSNVEPMFTGINFGVLVDGLAVDELDTLFDSCDGLDAFLESVGIEEADLGLDEGLLCQFFDAMFTNMDQTLATFGLADDPVNVGKVFATLLANETARPDWLSEEGVVTLGKNSAMCQVTPDPFRITLEDVGGDSMDSLVVSLGNIVDGLVDTANTCLGGVDSEDYSISSLNFDDVAIEQQQDGSYALVGELWGGAGKSPAGIFDCLTENVGDIEIQLADGSKVTVGNIDFTQADGECDGNDEYAQCDGSAPPADSEMAPGSAGDDEAQDDDSASAAGEGHDAANGDDEDNNLDVATVAVTALASAIAVVAVACVTALLVRKAQAKKIAEQRSAVVSRSSEIVQAVVVSGPTSRAADPAAAKARAELV